MKEVNQPEEKQEKQKVSRPYVSLTDVEVTELVDNYRSVLKKETSDTRRLLTEKIEELENELAYRSKLFKPSK